MNFTYVQNIYVHNWILRSDDEVNIAVILEDSKIHIYCVYVSKTEAHERRYQ